MLDGADLENALRARAKMIAAVADGGAVGAGPSHWYENLTARSRRSSLIIDPPDGRLPALTPEAVRRGANAALSRRDRGPADSWTDRSLWDRCITVGLPSVMFPTASWRMSFLRRARKSVRPARRAARAGGRPDAMRLLR